MLASSDSSTSIDYAVIVRDGVVLRRFPEAMVAFHPDRGDIYVLKMACGEALQVLIDARQPLAGSEIRRRLLDCGFTDESDEQLAEYLDVLESQDLIRAVRPA